MAGDDLLVGIDFGTSHIKAIAFTRDGQIVASASAPTPTVYPQPGWAYYEPDAVWAQTVVALQAMTAKLDDPRRIVAVAVASVGEAGAPIDAAGQPTYPMIAWFDTRTKEQAEQLRQRFGADAIFRSSGVSLQPIFTLCKILWIQQHAPEAMARTVRWLNAADFLTFRLCGVAASEFSLASRTLMLDIDRLTWATDLVRDAGVDPAILPPLLPSGTKLGVILPEVAAQTGLPAHALVTTGGHDHVCGAMALGVTRPGAVLDSLGTAEKRLLPPTRCSKTGSRTARLQGVHVSGGYYVLGGLYTSSACIEWFRENIGAGLTTLHWRRRGSRTAGQSGRLFPAASAHRQPWLRRPALAGDLCRADLRRQARRALSGAARRAGLRGALLARLAAALSGGHAHRAHRGDGRRHAQRAADAHQSQRLQPAATRGQHRRGDRAGRGHARRHRRGRLHGCRRRRTVGALHDDRGRAGASRSGVLRTWLQASVLCALSGRAGIASCDCGIGRLRDWRLEIGD